jgi:adenylate cyclase
MAQLNDPNRWTERPLDAREKPALIQKRRLMQAGFEESDHLEEMGMEDLSMLCTFVYRLPKLPSVDSVRDNRLT